MALQVVCREWSQPQPMECGTFGDLTVAKPWGQGYRQMQTRLFAGYLYRQAQLVLKTFHQCTAPLPVQRTHPPDVPGEMTFFDEVCRNQLQKGGRGDVHSEAYLQKTLD